MTRSSWPVADSTPLHERIAVLGKIRGVARSTLFRFLDRLAGTDDAKSIQVSTLRNLLARRAILPRSDSSHVDPPYSDLGTSPPLSRAALRTDVVIITARFRTGSTMLWNLFRQLPETTAYYEPFNERRWFDPTRRGNQTDRTHRGVVEYWREYDGLEELGQYYQERWIDHDLFMDEQSWNPAMKQYVERLIDHSSGRPVLQFNRIDFRLSWICHHFPRAKLVHLYRHPRDQWCSSLVDPAAVPRTTTMAEFGPHDHFYLRNWARDLKYYFPFLDECAVAHPYQLFYHIWKLSYLFGRRYAHHSLSYEELATDPLRCLDDLFHAMGIENAPTEQLAQQVEAPRSGLWRAYAPEDWFREQEAACERVLAEFLAGY